VVGRKNELASWSACSRHFDNRNGDPQRHIHCTVLTPCLREDGSWASVEWSEAAGLDSELLGPLFRCELATLLQERFGLRVGTQAPRRAACPVGLSCRTLPKELVRHWSSRREEILQELKEAGLDPGNASAGARTRANLESRQSKNDHQSTESGAGKSGRTKQRDWGFRALRVRDRQKFQPRSMERAMSLRNSVRAAAKRLHEQTCHVHLPRAAAGGLRGQ
jgi:hypothetical protein